MNKKFFCAFIIIIFFLSFFFCKDNAWRAKYDYNKYLEKRFPFRQIYEWIA